MLKTDKLYFSYNGSPPYILDDINLEINDGEYVSVMGDNGSGKSTLIRLILKFLIPTKGVIINRASRIGYVPQRNDFSNSGFPITVCEMLNSYRKLLKIKRKECISELLEQTGMTGFEEKLMSTLSGGQSQKLLISRALMGEPDLLVLDEPSTGVDMGSQQEIYKFLREINRDRGVTIISVEHNLDAAILNSTQIYHLSDGKGHLCTPEQYTDEYLMIRRKENFIAPL
jgi:ABC-type Mn/Zn transport systems, ATPase component